MAENSDALEQTPKSDWNSYLKNDKKEESKSHLGGLRSEYDNFINRKSIEKHGKLEGLNSQLTNRGLEEYLEILGINLLDLRGRVLDIGSGEEELFSKEASIHNITVDSVNPQLIKDHVVVNVKKPAKVIPWQRRSIAAKVQALPIQDNSYDTIVSVYAVTDPDYVPSDDMSKVVDNIVRVLKTGGKAYLGPCRVDEPIVREMEKKGINYTFKLQDNESMLGTVVIAK